MKNIYSFKNLVFGLLVVATITLTTIILAIRNRCDINDGYSQTSVIKGDPIFQFENDKFVILEKKIAENLITDRTYIATFTPSKDQKMTNQEILLELIRIDFDRVKYYSDYRINYVLVYNSGIVRIYYDIKPNKIDGFGSTEGYRFGDWWAGLGNTIAFEILKTGEQYYFYRRPASG
jgi:hypothetical protein